jgi:hypothetical protein
MLKTKIIFLKTVIIHKKTNIISKYIQMFFKNKIHTQLYWHFILYALFIGTNISDIFSNYFWYKIDSLFMPQTFLYLVNLLRQLFSSKYLSSKKFLLHLCTNIFYDINIKHATFGSINQYLIYVSIFDSLI